MNAVEAESLTKRFKQLRGYRDLVLYPLRARSHLAVDSVSLEIHPGELFGLLGENGAGKTTLIRMLTTSLTPTSGRAVVAGHDVVREPLAVRRNVGIVSGDDRSLYWRLTGRENLFFFAALHHLSPRIARQRIAELIEVLNLGDFADRRVGTYSSGMRQKLAIARGLLTEPAVLFMDEPTRALDVEAASDLRRLIKEFVVPNARRAVFLTTHSLAEAEALCDRLAIIRAGRIVVAGTLEQLRAALQLSMRCEIVLKGPAGQLERPVKAISGVLDAKIHSAPDGSVTVLELDLDRDEEVVDRVLRTVLDGDVSVMSVVTSEPSLESIYRHALAADREATQATLR